MFYYVLLQIVLLLLLLLLLSACPKAWHLVDETTVKGKGLLLKYRANVHCNILCTCNVHCLFTFTDRHTKCNTKEHCNILHMCANVHALHPLVRVLIFAPIRLSGPICPVLHCPHSLHWWTVLALLIRQLNWMSTYKYNSRTICN